ncbi:helix-turn-helix transcriptional regulator [Listeria booriae]|uniref:helix-turn-helix domain-containing protein n=1 Tax=Listeria booriae TaxID=1552123 RepID=UPI001626FA62|nr:helix-turn-helix domain-containing protein [Listeria booriae]MBC1906137.1 helix-turn-helix transcriptional regulator [Listeria booriae]
MQTKIATNFRLVRKVRGYTQSELASGICSQSLVSRFEKGLDVPNAIVLNELCVKLGISIDDLFVSSISRTITVTDKIYYLYQNEEYNDLHTLVDENQHAINRIIYNYLKGLCLYKTTQDYEKAVVYLEYGLDLIATEKLGILSFNELEAFVFSDLGMSYLAMNKKDEAEKHLVDSVMTLEKTPTRYMQKFHARIYYHIGYFYIQNGDLKKAMTFFDMGIEYCKNNSYLYFFNNCLLAKKSCL